MWRYVFSGKAEINAQKIETGGGHDSRQTNGEFSTVQTCLVAAIRYIFALLYIFAIKILIYYSFLW